MAYEMPKARIGQVVLWYQDGKRNSQPVSAFVTNMGIQSVTLSVFREQHHMASTYMGVRHVDDPNIKEDERERNGAWDHTEDTKALYKLIAELAPGVSFASK